MIRLQAVLHESFNRRRDFLSPSPPNSPYHFWSEYETPIEFRRRVGRRSGGHGKDGKRQRVVLTGKERAAPRTEGSTDMISSGGDGKAGHRSHRRGGKENKRSRGREPLPRRLPRPAPAPPRSANAHTRRCESRSRSRGDAGGFHSRPPPHLPQRTPSPSRSGDVGGGTPGHPPSLPPWRTL